MELPSQFAIKHLPTGNYLPDTRRGSKRSFVEPIPVSEIQSMRLFSSRRRAEAFLTSWLQGYHHIEWDEGGQYVGLIEHLPHRRRIDMRVVEIKLMEVDPNE